MDSRDKEESRSIISEVENRCGKPFQVAISRVSKPAAGRFFVALSVPLVPRIYIRGRKNQGRPKVRLFRELQGGRKVFTAGVVKVWRHNPKDGITDSAERDGLVDNSCQFSNIAVNSIALVLRRLTGSGSTACEELKASESVHLHRYQCLSQPSAIAGRSWPKPVACSNAWAT
jgi:hypothetical protein